MWQANCTIKSNELFVINRSQFYYKTRGPRSSNKFLRKMMPYRVQIVPRRSFLTRHKLYAIYSRESSYYRKFWIFHLFSSLLSSTSQVLTIPFMYFLPFSLSITWPPTPLFAAVSQLILAPGLPRPVCLGLLRLLGLPVGLLFSCAVCLKRQLVSKLTGGPGHWV